MKCISRFQVERDKVLIDATTREVYEETGFWVEIGNLLAVNEAKFLNRNHHAIFLHLKHKS